MTERWIESTKYGCVHKWELMKPQRILSKADVYSTKNTFEYINATKVLSYIHWFDYTMKYTYCCSCSCWCKSSSGSPWPIPWSRICNVLKELQVVFNKAQNNAIKLSLIICPCSSACLRRTVRSSISIHISRLLSLTSRNSHHHDSRSFRGLFQYQKQEKATFFETPFLLF